MNLVVLTGNVVRDVEVRYTAGGTAVAESALAVNSKYKKGEEWVEKTMFVDFTVFARQAEVLGEYVTKGQKLLIEGELEQQTWEKDGQKRSKHVVKCHRFEMLSGKKTSVSDETTQPQPTNSNGGGTGEDIPF